MKKSMVQILLLFVLCSSLGASHWSQSEVLESSHLWELWPEFRISPDDPYKLRHSELVIHLNRLVKRSGGRLTQEVVGKSAEGRSISLLQWGRGSTRVLLWSQMHGDEPTATSALLDIMNFLLSLEDEPWVQQLEQRLQLLIIPMLNPDGAERTRRRNAQGIDINRDALTLTTPEGRTLKQVRNRFSPQVGFNLHNQSPRVSVGDTLQPVMISLLAVPFDESGNDNPGRIRSKKICSRIYRTLGPYCYGQIARYEDSFNVRAFGDQMTAWGTPTVLIESGSLEKGPQYLVRLNFLALLDVFHSLASGSLDKENPAVYDSLKGNRRGLIYDWILRGVTVLSGNNVSGFKTDVGIDFSLNYGESKEPVKKGSISEIGDMSVFHGSHSFDASSWVLSPSNLEDGEVEGEVLPGSKSFLIYRLIDPKAEPVSQNLELMASFSDGILTGELK
jgi:hypothetical protein